MVDIKIEGNIKGLGIYCFKDAEKDIVRYVGSGMMNDRLQNHKFNLTRELYTKNNKKILQDLFNEDNLKFEVIHFSENNSTYINGTKEEREAIQESLEALEQFYVDLYKDTICNKVMSIKKTSTSPNLETTIRRSQANRGSKNPNHKYDEKMIAEILFLKLYGYKPKEIENFYKGKINKNYITQIGITKWIHLEPIKPEFIKQNKVVSTAMQTTLGATANSTNVLN